MKFGVSLTTAYPSSQDPVTMMENLLGFVDLIERRNFDSVWVGDHHITSYTYFQNIPTIAHLIAHTKRMQVGAMFLLPFFNPVLLAEQIATLDVISRGRFTVKVAVGDQKEAFRAFQIPISQRGRRLEEALKVMRTLWEKDNVSYKGRFWRFENISINPKPLQKPLPVWIGADEDPAIERAARLGDAWLIGPWANLERIVEKMALYKKTLQKLGRVDTIREFPARRDFHLAEDQEAAKNDVKPLLEKGYRGFTPEQQKALIIGGPKEVAANLMELKKAGITHVLFRPMLTEQTKVLRSFEIFADEVASNLR